MLLLEDYKPDGEQPDVDGLRRQLSSLPGFSEVELTPNTRSSVFVSVRARNQRELDNLKALVSEHVNGWRLVEEQSYDLPKTF